MDRQVKNNEQIFHRGISRQAQAMETVIAFNTPSKWRELYLGFCTRSKSLLPGFLSLAYCIEKLNHASAKRHQAWKGNKCMKFVVEQKSTVLQSQRQHNLCIACSVLRILWGFLSIEILTESRYDIGSGSQDLHERNFDYFASRVVQSIEAALSSLFELI